MNQICSSQKIKINHYSLDKNCDNKCKFCKNIRKENWKRVKRYIKRNTNNIKSLDLIEHKQVKWVLPDRQILASLPSYSTTRIMFITKSGEIEGYIGYRIGYYKAYATWIPYTLNKLWGIQAYKYFRIENTDKNYFKSFKINTNHSIEYLKYEKFKIDNIISDTTSTNLKFNLPLEYILLSSAFEGEFNLYNDYKYSDKYLKISKGYIDELVLEKKVYHLCLFSAHQNLQIAKYALASLKELHDFRSIPFLIQLVEYFPKNTIYSNEFEQFKIELITTINVITNCIVLPNLNQKNTDLLINYIPIWKSKFYL